MVLCSLSILVFLLFLNTHFSKFLFGIVFVLFLRENSFSYALGELGKSEREKKRSVDCRELLKNSSGTLIFALFYSYTQNEMFLKNE